MESKGDILVVDDDPAICDLLDQQLTREGFRVAIAADAEQMRTRMNLRKPDLVILDLVLPGTDGLSLAREIRAGSDIPIVMLTGKGDTVDKVVGLEVGADDYITKPFEQRELIARINTILRRTQRGKNVIPDEGQAVLEFEGWRLDLLGHELHSPDAEPVHLTTYEFQLLASFARHPNQALSRDRLLDLVGHRDWEPTDRSIDVLVGKLRQKIEPDPKAPKYVKTIRGVGYKFAVRVTAADS